MTRGNPFGPEPVTVYGAPMLTHNHVLLLQALLDRPGARVGSYNEWVAAAMPYARMMRPNPSEYSVRRGIHTLNEAWASRAYNGSRIAVTITERGRAILDRRIAAYVRGYGPYRGIATIQRTQPRG